jgi:hypothetical protein
VVAKGARKSGSRLAGSSDPLAVAQLGLATGKKNTFITQAQPLASFRGLRTDFERLSFALALLELYAAVIPYEQPDPDVYDLLVSSLQVLEAHAKPVVALVWLELRLLSYSGFLPSFDVSAVSGEAMSRSANEIFLSADAGGYVSAAESLAFGDRFRARGEVLLGLARTSEVSEPPSNLKFAEECVVALYPFWRRFAEMQLPANEAFVNEMRLKVMAERSSA